MFGRTTEKKVDAEFTENENTLNINGKYSIIYDDTDTTASSKILSYKTDFTFNNGGYSKEDFYEYDNRGNITGIYNLVNGEKTYAHKYVYDEANQLVREDFPSQNQTIKYTYDKGGNIVSKEVFDYCAGEITGTAHNYDSYYYTYSDSIWKDMLTSVNGNAVKSDAMGNITEYNGVTYEWNVGRQLSKTTDKDGESMLYYYNEDGFLAKIESYDVDGNYAGQRDYIWNGGRLVGLCFNSNDFDEAYRIKYIYAPDGEIQGCIINNKSFILYEKNLQGDVSGLISVDKNKKISDIAYDGYGVPYAENQVDGEVVSLFLYLILCPIFYRGYLAVHMSDGEIMFFLGSRFYNPELCRFFNADVYIDTQQGCVGTNMFAYCNNNPIIFIDPDGTSAIGILKTLVNIISRIALLKQCYNLVKSEGLVAGNYVLDGGYMYLDTLNKFNISSDMSRVDLEIYSNVLGVGKFKTNALCYRFTIETWKRILAQSFLERIKPIRHILALYEELDIALYALNQIADEKFEWLFLFGDCVSALDNFSASYYMKHDYAVLEQKIREAGLSWNDNKSYLTIVCTAVIYKKFYGRYDKTKSYSAFKGAIVY